VVDGLKGFPEAILAVFPEATVQTCIVHLLRHSPDFVSRKDRKPVAAALRVGERNERGICSPEARKSPELGGGAIYPTSFK